MSENKKAGPKKVYPPKAIPKKTPSKSANKKVPVNKPKKTGISPFLLTGLILTIIVVVALLLFIFFKKKNNPAPPPQTKPTKPIYLTATKEPDKIDLVPKPSFKKAPDNTEKKPNDYLGKKKSSVHSTHDTSVLSTPNKDVTDKKNAGKAINYPNKFVSSAKEWQPINPGLREATNRFNNLVYGGKPITIIDLKILENISYYSAYSEKRKNPIWVAYRLDVHKGQNKLSRPGKFMVDLRTKSKVNQGIYSKTGYDRGHMCPNSAIAARYGKKGQMETFLMSNITPQKPELNRKVWERLERLEEAYANKFGGIWIITGPIFDQHVELLNHLVEIPDSFFKILIDEDKGKVRVLPFIVPQNVTGKEILNEFLTSVDEIERKTGLDFFSPMDDEYENKLESYVPDKTMWN